MGEAVTVAAESLAAEGVVEPELARRLASIVPTTVHSLLGWKDRTHFRHGRSDPLPHDLVVIDETSMLSLPLTAKLLDAVRPDARLVLVGDPFQLASIEAGTVMSDLVGPDPQLSAGRPLSGRVTVLSDMRRFAEESGIAALAAAVRDGDADAALSLLAGGARDVTWVDPGDVPGVDAVVDQVVAAGADVVTAALRGDASGALAAARSVKVLAATRHGHLGVDDWTARIESTLAARIDGYLPRRRWHIGRPVMVTGNDRTNGVFNGDTGVVVHTGATAVVAMPSGLEIRHLAPSRLDRVETWWAMTVHKSQGSEFPTAVVSLPEWRSPILTRELLYTAVTRAEGRLTLIATEEAVRDAIGQPMARASGLQERLWPD
jgi:exodeoxyribonuclease V alpha subunit